MKKSRLVLLLVTAVLVASAGIAQAALITNVVRANGQSNGTTNRPPIGSFLGDTAPLPGPADGLRDSTDTTDTVHTVFSDRMYPWINSPAELIGSEYVRTFNNDKNTAETDVTYTVTFSSACKVWLTIDDRVWTAFPTPQAAADEITKLFAAPGTFTDTGLDLFIKESATMNRPLSVFSANLQAGTYVFSAAYNNANFYTIGAIPEPMTLSLLGLGGLIVARKRS